MNFKDIHIGKLIEHRINEMNIDLHRISNFLDCSEDEIEKILSSESVDSLYLLKFSKLLEYDFFRIYSQHLLLYSSGNKGKTQNNSTELPKFRKNIYTKEIVDFILEVYRSGEKTKQQIITEYKIPKVTLYKWINKYNK